jgi:uncharacterized protein YabE (DUF348 family)
MVYSTDFVDIGVKEVKQYFVSETATKELKDAVVRRGRLDKKRTFRLFSSRNKELPAKDKKSISNCRCIYFE